MTEPLLVAETTALPDLCWNNWQLRLMESGHNVAVQEHCPDLELDFDSQQRFEFVAPLE
jgi:hypothetical protein